MFKTIISSVALMLAFSSCSTQQTGAFLKGFSEGMKQNSRTPQSDYIYRPQPRDFSREIGNIGGKKYNTKCLKNALGGYDCNVREY